MGRRKVAAPKKNAKDFKSQHAHLFKKKTRDFRIGRDIQPKRDLSRFVRWPRYVRLQRQKSILKKRLKVPPAIHHFTKTIDKNQATSLFNILKHYRPEDKTAKKERLQKEAKAKAESKGPVKAAEKPKIVKFGLSHITSLIEERSQELKLVAIAHDVEPIELVVWLPALCRKFNVPYCIVKGKARLGAITRQKTATCVALMDVHSEHQRAIDQFVSNVSPMYNDAKANKTWGQPQFGIKSMHKKKAREKIAEAEAAKRDIMA